MQKRRNAIAEAGILLAIFFVTWLTRTIAASAFVTWDEPAWVYRSVKFLFALRRGDLARTMLVGHPGVLTMWSGALSLAWHRFVSGPVFAAQLAAVDALPSLEVHDPEAIRQLVALLPCAKGGIILLHALLAVALFLLLARLLDRRYALVAALFLASDPYYLALSRVLHIDALTSGLMLVSVVSALVYVRQGARRYLLLSAVAVGAATLTKSYGALAAPVAGLLIATARLCPPPGVGTVAGAGGRWQRLLRVLCDLLVWAGMALVVFIALWPALWVAPLGTLRAMLGLSLEYATTPGDATASFFRGQFVADPGLAFYPVVMWFRTTPLVLVGCILSLAGLQIRIGARRERDRLRRSVTLALVAYVALYVAVITLSRKKYDRYMLPALLALDLVAALGWAWALECALWGLGWRSERVAGARQRASAGLASLLALAQAAVLLGHLYPASYLAYYNPWAGGPARAVATIPVGWGEGVERAARYLAARPDAAELRVATWAVAGVAPAFPGQVTKLTDETIPIADYVLLYVGDVQNTSPLAQLFYGRQQPEYVVRLNGIEYAWLYRNAYCKQLHADLQRDAGPRDVVVANVHSLCERQCQGNLQWSVVDAATEEAVAAQLQHAGGASEHIFYLEFQGQPRTPGELIRRQLSQAALLLWQRPFAYGTLSCYLRPAASSFHAAQPALPAAVDLGPLRLERCGLWGSHVQYRQEAGLGLEWRITQPVGQDLHYSLRLVDAQGHWWGQRDGPLESTSYRRTSAWPVESVQRSYQTVPLAPGVPPGRYWVLLTIYSLQDQSPLPVTDQSGGRLGNEYRLGPLQVDSAIAPPAIEDLAIPHPADLQLGDWAQVLGYALPEGGAESGEDVEVSLFWRCRQKTSVRYELGLRLERDGETVASQRFDPAGPDHPTDHWSPGEVFRYAQPVEVPAEAATGDYSLYLNLYSPEGRPLAAADLLLARLHVEHRERLFAAPPIRFPLQAGLGEQIQLLGYDLAETTVRPGEVLHLTLYWRALGRPDREYTVFTHLLDAQGAVRGQRDSAPLMGQRPTTGWLTGEFLVDTYEIPVAAEAQPGVHQIEIGFYDPATGQRLPVTRGGQPTGEDRVLLPASVAVN